MMPAKRARSGADAERVMNAVRRLVRALRSSTAAVERSSGISGAQLFVLRALVERPGQSLRELVAHTLTSQSSVSEVVAKLVAAGLVTRRTAEQDGRRAVLSATARGRALSGSSPPAVQADLVAGLGALPTRTRRTLAEGLEQWLGAAGLEAVPPSMFFEPKQRPRPARAG